MIGHKHPVFQPLLWPLFDNRQGCWWTYSIRTFEGCDWIRSIIIQGLRSVPPLISPPLSNLAATGLESNLDRRSDEGREAAAEGQSSLLSVLFISISGINSLLNYRWRRTVACTGGKAHVFGSAE